MSVLLLGHLFGMSSRSVRVFMSLNVSPFLFLILIKHSSVVCSVLNLLECKQTSVASCYVLTHSPSGCYSSRARRDYVPLFPKASGGGSADSS